MVFSGDRTTRLKSRSVNAAHSSFSFLCNAPMLTFCSRITQLCLREQKRMSNVYEAQRFVGSMRNIDISNFSEDELDYLLDRLADAYAVLLRQETQ